MVDSGEMARARTRNVGPAAAIAATIVLAAVAVRCIRSDELHCENAVARLQQCCSGFSVDEGWGSGALVIGAHGAGRLGPWFSGALSIGYRGGSRAAQPAR